LNKSYGIQDNYEFDLDKLDSMLFVLSANEKHDLLFTPIVFHTKVFPAIYVVFLILNLVWFAILFYYGISRDIRFTSIRFWPEWTKFCIYQFLLYHYFETLFKNPFFLCIFLFLLLETVIHVAKKSTHGLSYVFMLASPFLFSLALISNNLAMAWFPIVFAAHSLHVVCQYKTKGALLSLLSLAAFALFSLFFADAHPDAVSLLLSILIVCAYRVVVCNQDHYKQIEEQGQEILKEKQQLLLYYQTAIETSMDGFAIFEIQEEHPKKKFICRHANPAVAKLLHLDTTEVLGQSVDSLFPDIHQIEKACRTVHQTGEPEMVDNVELTIDDIQQVFQFSLSKISNAIAMFIRNNTREYVLEKQIRHSQKMEAVGHLSGGIAHNINNLLTGILGNIAMAKRKDTASSTTYLEKAEEAANRAADLVKKLTAFSRKSAISAKLASPNLILDDVYNVIKIIYDPSIQIHIHQEDKLPMINADVFQINSVLMNLCGNARDAVQERLLETSSLTYLPAIALETACVTFSLEETASMPQSYPGTFVCFRVRDNGVGMDANTQKHLFEPFFTTKATLGTGLDLASAFGIIKQHKGWIAFESVKGKGSEFTIYIPVSTKEHPPAPRS
jgi:signal transduction histidine kinase